MENLSLYAGGGGGPQQGAGRTYHPGQQLVSDTHAQKYIKCHMLLIRQDFEQNYMESGK